MSALSRVLPWLQGLILVVPVLGYVYISGSTGSSGACQAITGALGLNPAGSSGTSLPLWTVKDLDGNSITSDSLVGKVVIVDFWATWCPPCREEIPAFIELQREYGDKGLVILGISCDETDTPVKAFIKSQWINYPIAMRNRTLHAIFEPGTSIPSTLILARSGRVVNRYVGYHDKSTFEQEIVKLLKDG